MNKHSHHPGWRVGAGIAALTLALTLSACGGGGGSPGATVGTGGGGGTGTGGPTDPVTITNLSFGTLTASPSSIQAYGSTVLSVDLMNGNAKYTDQQVNVTFSSACVTAGKATLATTVPTNNGTAQTVYRDQGCGNPDLITVSAAGVARSATAQLQIAPPAAASVQFVAATPTDQSIVIQGQGGNGRTETASLKFKVVDVFNNALPGKTVNFSASTTSVRVNKLSDTTDQNGEVITTVNSGPVATTFRVLATLPGTGNGGADIATWSDSLVVSTGLPVQRAFSLSAEKYNLDSTLESSPGEPATHVQIMIADASGNPVPDGTPVVFQTNMGSVGSADKGGCNTVNGGCSVDFRMQNPRVATPGQPRTPCNAVIPDSARRGVATVCASSTDGTNTMFDTINLFFSSNTAANVYLDGGSTPLNGTTDLGTFRSDAQKTIALQVNDGNDNPMPAGTKVEIINVLNVSPGKLMPEAVPNVSVSGSAAGRLGSNHVVTLSSTQPTGCSTGNDASFTVAITTPTVGEREGNATYYLFKMKFTCP